MRHSFFTDPDYLLVRLASVKPGEVIHVVSPTEEAATKLFNEVKIKLQKMSEGDNLPKKIGS